MNTARKMLVGSALVASTIAGGAIGASFMGTASAQTSDTTATTTAPSTSDTTTADKPASPHQANGKTETPLTGTDAEKATAAALAAWPGATVERVETDADGATY